MLANSNKKENNNQSNPVLLNMLIFKKYRVLNLISKGIFGEIYLVINENNNEFFAMKTEKIDSNNQLLELEAYNLYSIKGFGIPELKTFGIIKNYKILIEQLLSKSLEELFLDYNYKFSMKDICLISLQLIDRIEFIHNKTLVHRDIKPKNFLIDKNDANTIYLTEFGLCCKYCSSRTGKHILPGFKGTFTGTLRYSSANSQRGNQQSRRDDIESLGYTILYFMKGKLPWDNINQSYNEKEIYLKTYAMKKYMPIDKLCKGLPDEMKKYFKYTKGLKFQEKPNYEFLRNLFKKILKNEGIENYEDIHFSWVNSSINSNFTIKKRKALSPKARLYSKLINEMEMNSTIQSEYYKNNNETPINIKAKNYDSSFFNQKDNHIKNSSLKMNVKFNIHNKYKKEKNYLVKIVKQPQKELLNIYNSKNREIPKYINNINKNEEEYQIKKEDNNKFKKINNEILNRKKISESKSKDTSKINNKINKKFEQFNKNKLKNNNNLSINNLTSLENNKLILKNVKTMSNKENGNNFHLYRNQLALKKRKFNLSNISDYKNNDFINLNKNITNNNNKNTSTENHTNKRQNNYKYLNNNKVLIPIMNENKIIIKNSIYNNIYQNMTNTKFSISNNKNIFNIK